MVQASKVWAHSLDDLSQRIKTTQDNTNHDGGALRALAGRLTVGWTVAGAAIHPRLVRFRRSAPLHRVLLSSHLVTAASS